MKSPNIPQIQLRSYQKENAKNEREILKKYVSVIDTSDLGAGKTPVIVHTAQSLGLNLFVLTKKATVRDWQAYKKHVEFLHVMTYDSFRPKNKTFSHRWLEYDTEEEEIVPTQDLKKLIRKGCLFIFDESQATKNVQAQQSKACCAVSKIVRKTYEQGGKSRIALLSRTPTSGRSIQIVSLFRLAGLIINSEKLIEKQAGGYAKTGFKELVDYCSRINSQETDKIVSFLPMNNKSVLDCAYDLYERILKNAIVTTMENETKNISIYNVFFKAPEKNLRKLSKDKNIYQKISTELEKGEKKERLIHMYNIMERLQKVELYKEDIFLDVACELLEFDPNIKIILYLWTRRVIHRLEKSKDFKKYSPVIVNGQVTGSERTRRIEAFTDPNSESRILLTHPDVLSTGTNIIDPTETITFVSLMNPSVFYIQQHQASGRTTRGGKKKSYFLVVYLDGLDEEKDVLFSLSDKSDNLRRIVKTKEKLKFLTDYPVVYERDFSSICDLLFRSGF